MARAFLMALLMLAAGAFAAAAQQKSSRPLLPADGMWQSIPYAPAVAERDTIKPQAPGKRAHRAPSRVVTKSTAPPISKARPAVRNPVPAAAVPPKPPAETAAARTKELSRRLGVLAPGARLDEPIYDHENPAWRRQPPDRPRVEGSDLAVPFDSTGKAGMVARGYHREPAWNNPTGNTGATFSLRQRF